MTTQNYAPIDAVASLTVIAALITFVSGHQSFENVLIILLVVLTVTVINLPYRINQIGDNQ